MRDIVPYFGATFLLILSHAIFCYTGNYMLPFWFIYLFSPINNAIGKQDNWNISTKNQTAWANDKRFWAPLWVYTFAETISWLWCLTVMSDKYDIKYAWFQINKPSTYSEYIQFVVLFGFYAGISGISGHELTHKKEMYNKLLGNWSYSKFLYSHFMFEHFSGHHKNVATPLDTTSAKYGHSLYRFYLQSIPGSMRCVWKQDTQRIKKKHGDDVSFLFILFKNKLTWCFVFNTCFMTAIYLVFGWQSVKFQCCYALAGIFFLEGINYIEHYGLERKKDEDGIYESVTRMHSWNSLSGPVQFRLQRHSDHHAQSYRPYQILRRLDDAPTLPFDYVSSIVMCTIPPLWWYMVNPRVEAIRAVAAGKKNDTCYNMYMPMTKDDKCRKNAGWAFLFVF